MKFDDIIDPAMLDKFLVELGKLKFVEIKFYLRPDIAKEVIEFVEKLETEKDLK